MSIRTEVAVYNDKGRVRDNNEDNFFINGKYMARDNMDKGGLYQTQSSDEHQIYAVCDGMGGTDAGEEASLCAVIQLQDLLSRGDDAFDARTIQSFVQTASDRVYTESAQRGGSKSGTTLAMLVVNDGYARLVHVGDSRIYRLREGKLARMTQDHSEVQRMINMGLITAEQARTHPKRHVISQYLGMPPTEVILSPGLSDPEPLENGDLYLLCSDGVTDMVDDTRLQELILSSATSTEACNKVVGEALKNGGNDNTTALCVRVLDSKPGSGLRMQKMQSYACLGLIGLNIAGMAALLIQMIR